MIVKLKNLVEGYNSLMTLASMPFKAKVSYKIGRIVVAAEQELKPYEKQRVDLVTRYGEKDEQGNVTITDPAKMDTFKAEHDELLETEINIWGDPLALDDLGDKEIAPSTLARLDWLFQEVGNLREVERKAVANG